MRSIATNPAETATIAPLLTVREAAEALKISPSTAYRLVRAGELPAVRVGGSVRIDQTDLHRHLHRHAE